MKLTTVQEDALMELIQNNIATDSWTSDPNRTIQLMPGTLVVRQTSDVHAKPSAVGQTPGPPELQPCWLL